MHMAYGACNGRGREAAALYMRRFPERRQPYRRFFARLDSRLRRYGQFRPIKPAGIFIKSV